MMGHNFGFNRETLIIIPKLSHLSLLIWSLDPLSFLHGVVDKVVVYEIVSVTVYHC